MKRFLIPPALRPGANPYQHSLKDMGPNIKKLGSDATNSFKKNFDLSEPIFKKDPQGRNLNNLWTGMGYGGKGRAMATVSLIAGGTVMANRDVKTPMESEAMDVESLQSTRSDGFGYESQLGENSGLSASGDLVFAMHKTRHSGQF